MTIRSGSSSRELRGVELVDRLAGRDALAHRGVDLRGVEAGAAARRASARGSSRAAGGWSHSCVTAISSSPRPSAKQSSVAWGTRLTIRTGKLYGTAERSRDRRAPARRSSPAWRREGDALVGDRECADFAAVIALVNAIAAGAERADHHPDLLIHGYRRLRITLSTHSAGGITARDFALAARDRRAVLSAAPAGSGSRPGRLTTARAHARAPPRLALAARASATRLPATVDARQR